MTIEPPGASCLRHTAIVLTALLSACAAQPVAGVTPAETAALSHAVTAAPAGDVIPAPAAPTAPATAATRPAPPPDGLPLDRLVIEAPSLSGFWKLTGPKFIEVTTGLFSGVRIRYSADRADRDICLIDDRNGSLTGICSTGIARPATGSRDGQNVTLRWWTGPANVIFAGALEGLDRLAGTLSGGIVGISVTAAVPMVLSRLEISPDSQARPASAGLVQAALADLRNGALAPGRYGPAAIRHLHEAALTAPQDPVYLGSIHIRWREKQAEKIDDVYKVTTSSGQALCRVEIGDREPVADFECRGLAP